MPGGRVRGIATPTDTLDPSDVVRPAGQRGERVRRSVVTFGRDALSTARTFENFLAVAVFAGIVMPSRIPPRGGIRRLMHRRLAFRARAGAVLETEIGNASPIIEVYRDRQYDVPIDWRALHHVLDVGGHVGAFSIWAAHRAPHASVVVFEPEPKNYSDLVANLGRNGLANRVEAINAAVAVEDGKGVLHVGRSQREMSSLSYSADTEAIEVRCVGLSRYLEGYEHEVDVLKLDCEGAEWDLLPSLGPERLRRVRHVLVEAHAQTDDAISGLERFFGRRGFETRVLRRGSVPGAYAALATVWARRI